MELVVVYGLLLLLAAATASSELDAGFTASVAEAKVERIVCRKTETTTESGDKIAYATLNISKNNPLNSPQRLASIHWGHTAIRDPLTSSDVAVRGRIVGFSNKTSTAQLELLFRAIPLVKGVDSDGFDCQYQHTDDKKYTEKATVTKEDVSAFVCDAGETKDVVSMSLVERSGTQETVVGPTTTVASDGMQYYWDWTSAEPLLMFDRSQSRLIVFRSRQSMSPPGAQYFCRISTTTGIPRDFPIKPEAVQQPEKQTGEAAVESSYTWVGYPVILLILMVVVIGFVVVVVIRRKRRSRESTLTPEGGNPLIDSLSQASQV